MPRKVNNRNFYDHDDRTGGRTNQVRKVSFLNGSGRIRKNKRPEQIVMRYITDDDVVMGGAERKPWNGKRGARKNFKPRSGSPGVRSQQPTHPPLRLSDWYRVLIRYGSKYEKNTLLQLILGHITPHVFIPNSYTVHGNDVVFYVDDFEIAKMLKNANGKILLGDGHLMLIRVREGVPPSVPIDDKLREKLKLVMAKRYIAENKALDLSNFSSDPDFMGDIHCPLSRPPIMRVVWQIISTNISDLVALNLNNNKISVLENSLSVEVRKLKNLRILHLADNNIKSLQNVSCIGELGLTELVLRNNPLNKFYKDNTHYVRYDLGVTRASKRYL